MKRGGQAAQQDPPGSGQAQVHARCHRARIRVRPNLRPTYSLPLPTTPAHGRIPWAQRRGPIAPPAVTIWMDGSTVPVFRKTDPAEPQPCGVVRCISLSPWKKPHGWQTRGTNPTSGKTTRFCQIVWETPLPIDEYLMQCRVRKSKEAPSALGLRHPAASGASTGDIFVGCKGRGGGVQVDR